LHTRKIARFQGQIETALKKFRQELDLRMKEVFAKLRIQSHLTAAGIRKGEGYSPGHLLFVLTNAVFLQISTVHDLLSRPLKPFFQAHKDTFYRFKKAEWSWGAFYRRFLKFLGRRSGWFKSPQDNCFILDATILAKRGRSLENLTWVYDHCRGQTVKGYELLTLALLTVRNLFPLDFGFHFSKKAPAGARQAQPRRPRGSVARHLKVAGELTKVELALKLLAQALAQGITALYVLVDAWFTSPKFCQAVRDLGLHVIGRLKRDHSRYEHEGHWYTLDELYQRHKRHLVQAPELGLSLALVPVTCGHGLKATIVFAKGYQEPELEARPRGHQKARSAWVAFLCTDLTLTGPEVVQKYLGRWAIEVFFKEAKQRLGLGKEQGHSFAAQVFSVFQAFFRYSLLAYLLEHDERSQTMGEMFRHLEEETGKLTFLERLRHYLTALLRRICDTLADFYDSSAMFRAYLDVITNAFNDFPILQGCER
jgi:hypothetical protein